MEKMSETVQRQIDELIVLKSLFSNELKDLRHSSGDKPENWTPIEVQITLKPMVSMSELNKEVYVQLDLYVKCGKKYPNVIPDDISLRNVKGLSSAVVEQLRAELYALAKTMRGEVMVFAFTDHVRQYLHKHNKPQFKSFYEEMVSRENKLEIQKSLEIKKELESKRIRDELRRKHLEEELQRKQFALQKESRMRRESREDLEITNFGESQSEVKTCSDPPLIKCNVVHETICITFSINGSDRKIQRGKCIFHNHFRHSIEYLGLDLLSGEPFVIIEWTLDIKEIKQNDLSAFETKLDGNKKLDDIVSRVAKLETFFKTKMKSLNHSNLAKYLSMQYSIGYDSVVIYLLQEYISGQSLYNLANVLKGQPFDMTLVKYYSRQMLEALNYLHKHHCPHGDIRQTNVYIDCNTSDIRISGYYFEKQVHDIYCDIYSDETKHINSTSFHPNIHRLMIKDVYHYGLLIFAMSYDWNFPFDADSRTIFNLIENKDSNFKSFIEKCIDSEENARWSPELLLQHSFISDKNEINSNKTDYESKRRTISDVIPEQTDDRPNDKNTDTKVLLNSLLSSGMHSRLANEFEVLDELGKGGFGFVYKVKNLLDGRCYALKKIVINPLNQLIYQKIKREVNLLSRLNHENVVRYFCSWIETEANPDHIEDDSSSSGKVSDNLTQISIKKESDSKICNNEKSSDSTISDLSSIEDVDYEAEEDIFGTSFLVQIPHKVTNSSDDQYVVFEGSGYISTEESTIGSNSSLKNLNEAKPVKIPRQYMYIQMELCEKSTLRDAIDNGLYTEKARKSRLFREIVEGLVHINQQGMIHRDLKPGNIFLDVNDHVKIGDFGLAKEIYLIKEENFVPSDIQLNSTQESDKFRLTGRIGTPFYVAPELTVNADINSNRIFYTPKVDIYSLGIIFFEMLYPLKTSMERNKVITALRKPEVILPDDIHKYLNNMEIQLLKNLVQHDYRLRPTSKELLDSEFMPAPEMEVKEELNIIRRAVQNTKAKIHKYLLNLLFQKDCDEIEDYVYDVDDEQLSGSDRAKRVSVIMKRRIFQYVYTSLQAIMQSHSALYLSLPTLIPKYSTRKYEDKDVVYVIDQNGSIVALPHDLRVPFARYIARNNILNFRRYSIEKVYRQRKISSYHPRQLWECTFDIVTSKCANSSHIMPDAEVLTVLSHVIQQFPMLQGSGLTLKLNHMKLVKAILTYCEVPENRHKEAIKLIAENNSLKVRYLMLKESNDCSTHSSLKRKDFESFVEETKISLLFHLIDLEQESIKKMLSSIKTQMRKKGKQQQNALELAKQALKELEQIIFCAERLGNFNVFSIKISPSFVSSPIYSGLIFQLEREVKHKKPSQRPISSVIAIGGRYDDLINDFDVRTEKAEKFISRKGAVGLSIEFEKIMKIISEEELKTKTIFGETIEVVVCSLMTESSDSVLKEMCSITKEFWSFGIKVFNFPEDLPKNIDDLHSFCIENNVRYAIVLKDNSDSSISNFIQTTAKLFAYEKERFIDKKGGNISDIVEYVIRTISSSKNEVNNANTISNSDQAIVLRSDSNKLINTQSISSNESNFYSTTVGSNIKVHFMVIDKLQPIPKRRLESNIISHLSTALNFISNNTVIEVVAVDLPFKIIKTISGEIEFDEENDTRNWFEKSKLTVMDKHPRYRKYISEIMDVIFRNKTDKKCPIVCIISTIDNMKFKLLS